MSNLPSSPLPPPPPFLPGPITAVEFNPINLTDHMTKPNPSSKHTNHAFIISIIISAIGVILIGLVCFAIGYWLRKKLMAPPPPPPQRSSIVHQVPHHSQLDHPCCSHVPGCCSHVPGCCSHAPRG